MHTRAAPLAFSALSMLMTSLPVSDGGIPPKRYFMVTFLKCREGAGNKILGHSHPQWLKSFLLLYKFISVKQNSIFVKFKGKTNLFKAKC